MRRYGDLLKRLGRRRWFSRLTWTVLVPIDRWLWQRSGGRLSLGHVGGSTPALPALLLTTTGRRSGQPRSTPLLYLEDAGRLVVVASNFGRDRHPAWSENLLAQPQAVVQIGTRRRPVSARPADEAERAQLWPRLLEIYPGWEDYRERTDREFRAFFLEDAPG